MTTTTATNSREPLADQLRTLRGPEGTKPDASIVIPVNAQGDLENVLTIVKDLAGYQGEHHLEIILVVNNYTEVPAEVSDYRQLGLQVVTIPSVRRDGEAVGFSARIPGIREAGSETVILFDADCRVPNPTDLIDWYIARFNEGADAAYTHVAYYDYQPCLSLRLRFALHHLSRWGKRNLFKIPTTRGSNYTVRRQVMLDLYERGMLADEMNVGPTFQAEGHRVAYSGARNLAVLTSGRMFRPGWLRMVPYFLYRLKYNIRTLPVRIGVASHTGRERDPVRKYVNNRPVR